MRHGIIGVFLGLFLAACAHPDRHLPKTMPQAAFVDSVPFYPQQENLCGPAALAMTLNFVGAAITTEDLQEIVYTPEKEGAFAADMIAAVRRQGYNAIPITTWQAAAETLLEGYPVVIMQNLGLSVAPQWHFAVLLGYDSVQQTVRLHSGESADMTMPLSTFLYTWQRSDNWGIVITKPSVFPTVATRLQALTAANGLERAENFAAAIQAYQTIKAQWQEDCLALIGQGTSFYALGNRQKAADAWQQALLYPRCEAAAQQNLSALQASVPAF